MSFSHVTFPPLYRNFRKHVPSFHSWAEILCSSAFEGWNEGADFLPCVPPMKSISVPRQKQQRFDPKVTAFCFKVDCVFFLEGMEAGEGSPFTLEKPMDRGMERKGGRMEGDLLNLYNLQEYFPTFFFRGRRDRNSFL
jgi:hypothetical protein